MAGIAGYNGWRWIFIVEGLLTIVVAAISKWFIVDWPHEAKFLNAVEKDMLVQRLNDDISHAKMNHWNGNAARRILKDWKIYVG